MKNSMQNKTNSLVSLGLPVYNGENYIKEAINSIIKQKYKNWELIISDNCSTDSTEKICRAYVKKDKRIKYYRYDANRGAAWNYNNCFKLSNGEYFKWAAHDDNLAPGFLSECVDVLRNNNDVVLVYPLTYMIDAEGKILKVYSDEAIFNKLKAHERYRQFFQVYKLRAWCNPIFGLFRRDILARTVLIGSWLASDLTLLGEVVLYGKFYQIDKPLFYQRIHKDNSMQAYNEFERVWWFDPKNLGKPFATHWRWMKEYISAVKRARLGFKERILCKWEILRWSFRIKKRLFKEGLRFIFWPMLKRTKYKDKIRKKFN
ncbi:TPA: glycosyltransferase [Candidatus Woesearchaeota archaeon]|nr:glycosyltransferase [Candidatus Woesearchaeota archaeon]